MTQTQRVIYGLTGLALLVVVGVLWAARPQGLPERYSEVELTVSGMT